MTTSTSAKSGRKTSEFQLSALTGLVTIVCATLLVLAGRLDGTDWSVAILGGAGLPAAGYSVSRALAKR